MIVLAKYRAVLVFLGLFFICMMSMGQNTQLPIQIDVEKQREFISQDTLSVKIERLSSIINTPYSEYNPMLFQDSLFFFATFRPESEGDYQNLFEEFWSAGIFSSLLAISGFSTPRPLPLVINSPRYYNCNYTFNNDRTLLYFSRCIRAATPDLQCELWESKFTNGKWEKASKLNRRINLPGTTTTQPYLVEYDDCNLLFFVSDRPNGVGKLDIWYTIYKNGRFEDPINAGVIINTPGNEVTPFYDIDHSMLYFSSDQHLTIGGYDIFSSSGSFSAWKSPHNMGVQFNSPFNDFYFTVNTFRNGSGFFASNRPIGKMKSDTCCHDIYQYEWIPKQVDTTEMLPPSPADTIPITAKIQDILPLTLYFHNDEPDPRSLDTITKKNYKTTLSDYIVLKELYKEQYSKGLKYEAKEEAEEIIERFFIDSVQLGFKKLELFTQYLLQELEAGKKVEIKISGFASPLHKEEYNRRLSSRRIESLINFIREYEDGIFVPYIQNRQLVLISDPKGKSTADKHISDNVQDQRNSIYSIAASLERRIQITEYKSK